MNEKEPEGTVSMHQTVHVLTPHRHAQVVPASLRGALLLPEPSGIVLRHSAGTEDAARPFPVPAALCQVTHQLCTTNLVSRPADMTLYMYPF